MGAEGAASRAYFAVLGVLLPDWVGFGGRNRRPPRDPANAALSFGYTLLTGEAQAACEAGGLDSHAGILHEAARRRPSLALDLVEEFRPVLVDTVVLDLFRRRRLREEHFRTRTEDAAVLLNDAGRRVLIDAYEVRLLSKAHSARRGHRITYREALHDQGRFLAEVVRDPTVPYRPVAWR